MTLMATVVGMARWWWAYILRGIVAIAFGVLALLSPMWGLAVLVLLFGFYALIEGAASVMTGIRSRNTHRNWWLELLEGIASIGAGVIALLFPGFALGILVLLIGIWAIIIGVFQVYMAVRLRDEIEGELWLGLAGAAAVLFGIATLLFPTGSALSLVWLIAAFAIAFGVLLIILGWRLRRINDLARRDAQTDYSRAP